MNRLAKKVVVITGGAGLIGSNFVKKVAGEGATAIIADIDMSRAEELSSELQVENPELISKALPLDVNSKESVMSLIEETHKNFGRIDALVNSAYPRNKNYGRHFFDVEYEDFCENLNLQLGGYFLCSQKFMKYFFEQGHGNIVNLSSIYGVVAPKFEVYKGTKMTMVVEYAAIKSALLHLTKYLAKYSKGNNVRVNAISPGGILDNQPEEFLKNYAEQCLNKGMLNESDLSGALIYLLSDESMYVNGQNIVIDDGFTL